MSYDYKIRRCCVENCPSVGISGSSYPTMHTFPKDEPTRGRWVKFTRKSKGQICSRHFESRLIWGSMKHNGLMEVDNFIRLESHAVPTLHPPPPLTRYHSRTMLSQHSDVDRQQQFVCDIIAHSTAGDPVNPCDESGVIVKTDPEPEHNTEQETKPNVELIKHCCTCRCGKSTKNAFAQTDPVPVVTRSVKTQLSHNFVYKRNAGTMTEPYPRPAIVKHTKWRRKQPHQKKKLPDEGSQHPEHPGGASEVCEESYLCGDSHIVVKIESVDDDDMKVDDDNGIVNRASSNTNDKVKIEGVEMDLNNPGYTTSVVGVHYMYVDDFGEIKIEPNNGVEWIDEC